MSEDSLVKAFGESIKENIIDTAIDIAEIGIDAIFQNSVLKEIPIIKTVYAMSNCALSIRDKFFCQRTLAFLQEFEQGKVKQDDIENHISSVGREGINKEIEVLIQYIDLCAKIEHSKMLARFYIGYLRGEITRDVFDELAEANRRVFICDYQYLKQLVSLTKITDVLEDDESTVNRLSALGLVIDSRIKMEGVRVVEQYVDRGVHLSRFGKVFGRYLNVTRDNLSISVDKVSRYDKPMK